MPLQKKVPPQSMITNLSREDRPAWFDNHPLNTVSDLLRYPPTGQVHNLTSPDVEQAAVETSECRDTSGHTAQVLSTNDQPDLSYLAGDYQDGGLGWAQAQASNAPVDSNDRDVASSWNDPLLQLQSNVWPTSPIRNTFHESSSRAAWTASMENTALAQQTQSSTLPTGLSPLLREGERKSVAGHSLPPSVSDLFW
jgi:hypothetical protein